MLPVEHAVLALNLADDEQVFALNDRDSRVLARRATNSTTRTHLIARLATQLHVYLPECAWPAALDAVSQPLDSLTWWAAMAAMVCDPAQIRRLGLARFNSAGGVS